MPAETRWWTDKQFGRLRIVADPDLTDVTKNGPRVRCLCACGNSKVTRLYPLKSGRVRSCGCLQKEGVALRSSKRSTAKDRTGLRRGKLVFMREAGASNQCMHWWVRCDCGVEFSTRGTTKAKSCKACSRENLRGAGSTRWRGGKFVNSTGYVVITVPGHHRAGAQGYVLEHIVVAEKYYGTRIARDMSVHHINGIRSDNRPENLEIWDRAHPAGQRLVEKLDFYEQQLIEKATPERLALFREKLDKL